MNPDNQPIIAIPFVAKVPTATYSGPAHNAHGRPVPDFSDGIILSSDLDVMPIDERPALLGDWMKRGDFGYLYAPRGVGKTWMAMLIGNAVCNGWPLGKWSAGEIAPVVIYLDAEMNLADVRARGRGIGIRTTRFRWLSNEALYLRQGRGVNIADPGHQQALSNLLPEGCFFVIDNLSTAQIGMAENDNDSFDALRDWILTLRHRGITTMIVHHAGRNGAMRGASRREDMAHWIISLKESPEEKPGVTAFISNFEKCRNCQVHLPLRWTLANGPDGLTITCDLHSGPDSMLLHIRDGVTSATELAELIGVPKGTVSKWAKKLCALGKITRTHGHYVAVE